MPRSCPRWDVDGYVTLCAKSGQMSTATIAIRMFDDGHGTVTVNGVSYPIRKGMTADEHYDQMLGDAYGIAPLQERASGD